MQLLQRKEQEEKLLLKQVKEQPTVVSGQQLFNKIAGKASVEQTTAKEQNAGRNILSGMPSRRGTLKFYRGFNQKANSNVIAIGGIEGESLNKSDAMHQMMNGGASPYF